MTFPIHTTKHIGSSYRKLNIVSAAFTVITLAAALLAALSGIQLYNLQKKQAAEMPQTPPVEAPIPVDNSLVKELEEIKAELAREKEASKKLKSNISKLKKQKSALEKSIAATKTLKSAPPKRAPSTPSPKTPTEAVAPALTPAVPKPTEEVAPEKPADAAAPAPKTPQNAPLPDQPVVEKPLIPTEKTDPPAMEPEIDEKEPQDLQPQTQLDVAPDAESQSTHSNAEPAQTNEEDEAQSPLPEGSSSPIEQTSDEGSTDIK
jgi:hypothetical protein